MTASSVLRKHNPTVASARPDAKPADGSTGLLCHDRIRFHIEER
jgi:hypothetical protein